MANYYGIDVSSYQGTIDFSKVKSAGKSFVIIRSIIKSGAVDSKAYTNIQKATAAGLTVGIYKYVYATNTSDATKEANLIVSNFTPNNLPLGVWLDMEDSTLATLGKATLTNIINTMATILKNAGFNVGIYCNKYWYSSVLDSATLAKIYPFWIARYSSSDTGEPVSSLSPKKYACAWQYSQAGTVSGISGNVDMDLFFSDPSSFFDDDSTEETTEYYDKYTGSSWRIDTVFNAIGVESKYIGGVSRRKPIATTNGISNYNGTYTQNVALINLAKAGKLKKAG